MMSNSFVNYSFLLITLRNYKSLTFYRYWWADFIQQVIIQNEEDKKLNFKLKLMSLVKDVMK